MHIDEGLLIYGERLLPIWKNPKRNG